LSRDSPGDEPETVAERDAGCFTDPTVLMAGHRGPHPEDDELFAPSEWPRLRRAVHDLSWLRTRGYGDNAALKLVGDRYRLRRRQRNAVARSACSDEQRSHRRAARCSLASLKGQVLEIDGFNVLIALEGAIGGAYLFRGRDGAYRDVDAVQGTYRIVRETRPALRAVRRAVCEAELDTVVWRLDAHVSNVGRLRERIRAEAPETVVWTEDVRESVDEVLADTEHPVATSDSAILDRSTAWCALEPEALRHYSGEAKVCRLGDESES
jgi:hypothetical protein